MISTCLSKYFKGKIQIFTILLLILPCINAASQDTINVLFYPDSKGYKIPSDFAGLSFEKDNLNSFHFTPGRDTLIRLFQTLGIMSVRIGGNSVTGILLAPLQIPLISPKLSSIVFIFSLKKRGVKCFMA